MTRRGHALMQENMGHLELDLDKKIQALQWIEAGQGLQCR